ncbi:MAG: hypothetical protein QOD55_968 [Solirubrobacteraceae bacterium]|nr:hypothetical protein [Solirubrobacteraceae bacterium]
MRRPEPLDPAVAADLDALDAALSGAPGADPALAALVRDVPAVAPRHGADARAALDARVDAGFPRTPRRARPGGRAGASAGAPRRRRWALAPALGVAATALVALVVVLGSRGGAGDETGSAGGGSGSSAVTLQAQPESCAPGDAARDASGAAAPAPAPPAAAPAPATTAVPGRTVAPAPGRRVERTVSLELGAGAGRFDAVTDAVVRTTQRAGGFVAGSQVSRAGRRGTATFVLRIPAARLDAAVADLSRLAHVRSIEQATQDLTGAHDGTAARLRDERTRRRALVAALATATGDEAARLRARLAAASARVRRLERELRALRSRTTYATVDLTVIATRAAAVAPGRGDRWTPADAWRAALRGLEIGAGVLIIVAAFALPVAIVAVPAALATASLRRRRRETALDTA